MKQTTLPVRAVAPLNKRPAGDSAENSNESPFKRKAISTNTLAETSSDTPAGASKIDSALSPSNVYTWLNSLSDAEAIRLHELVNVPNAKRTHFIPLSVVNRLSGCTNNQFPARNGQFYTGWLECLISTMGPNRNGEHRLGHPRVRFTVPRNKNDATVQFYSEMKKFIPDEKMRVFDSLATRTEKNSSTEQVRIHVHHIAYNSCRSGPGYRPMAQCGKNLSVSHLCDQVGCVRLEHVPEFVTKHGDNSRRQRCRGIVLVIQTMPDGSENIVKEVPCVHAGSADITDESLAACCRKVCIIPLGEMWPELEYQWKS